MGIYSLHCFGLCEEVAGFCNVKFPVSWTELWANTWVCSVRMVLFIILLQKQQREENGRWESLGQFCTSSWQRSLFIHYLLCWGGFSIDDFYPQSQMVLWSIAVTSHPKLWEADRTISSSPTITNTLAVFLFCFFLHAVNRNLWTAIVYQALFDE